MAKMSREEELARKRARMRAKYASDPAYRERARVRNNEWRAKNRGKYQAYLRQWQQENREYVRTQWTKKHHERRANDPGYLQTLASYRLKNKYGITLDQFNQMLEEQHGTCPICERHAELVVDHDHATGVVRALLCKACNSALGFFGDDVERIERAIQYLEIFR